MIAHLTDLQLGAHLDGELGPTALARANQHLLACSACGARLRSLQRLASSVRARRPTEAELSAPGPFWASVASRLPATPPQTWPLLPFLPPALVSMAGVVLEALIAAAFAFYDAQALGLAPSVSRWLGERLPEWVGSPMLQSTIYAWSGWNAQDVSRTVTDSWAALGQGLQDGVLLAATVTGAGVLLAFVVAFMVLWALCWGTTHASEASGRHEGAPTVLASRR